ncbi:hypothetical protein BGX27_004524 [Mortierella sp. AM989]|nr:hypothetical protein BGX27_004524 [Mortierella sp. AM989]
MSDYYYNTPHQHQQQYHPHQEDQTAAVVSANTAENASWTNKPAKKSTRFKIIVGSLIALVAIAVAAVLAWHFTSNNSDNDSNQSSSSDTKNDDEGKKSKGYGNGPTVVAPNGSIIPNQNHELKRVFYGMAYVPIGAQLPNCYNTQSSMDQELKLLAQTTRRVRLYGTDCNVLKYTLDTIHRLKLDLKVVVGIWIDSDSNTYTRQFNEFVNVVTTFGWDNILGVSVGNEVLFDKYQPIHVLLDHIKQVKEKVVAMGHPEIPVFTSDLEGANKPSLTSHEDMAGVNLHPFFSGVPVSQAASWFWTYLDQAVKSTISSNKTEPVNIWITEVGWPTFPAIANTNASIPSIENLQTFIDTWVCDANAKGIPYYFFEFFDAPWKIWPGAAVEGFWGLLTIDMKLKVKLPDCLAN